MEEAQQILLDSLRNSGISIPLGVLSIHDLTPPSLFSICSQSLRIINPSSSSSFPDTLPDSMADQFNISAHMASAIKDFGYVGDISFHQLLYPSEDDLFKLVRFLIKKLSESSENGRTHGEENINSTEKLTDNQGTSEVSSEKLHARKTLCDNVEGQKESIGKYSTRRDASGEEENFQEFEQILSLVERSYTGVVNSSLDQDQGISDDVSTKIFEIQYLENEHEFLKTAVEMVFDDLHTVDFFTEKLKALIDDKTCNQMELQLKWVASVKNLEEKQKSLEEFLYISKPEVREKYQKLKEVELEVRSILSEISKREMEHLKFCADVEIQPKVAPRRYYVRRITEITKNSRKQEIDMERILKETRELQLESNSIQERLHRTYAIASETLLREAKKEQVGWKACSLLMKMHENFEEMSGKILATDRMRREIGEYEKKVVVMACRSLDVIKLQADVDSIRKENECLELEEARKVQDADTLCCSPKTKMLTTSSSNGKIAVLAKQVLFCFSSMNLYLFFLSVNANGNVNVKRTAAAAAFFFFQSHELFHAFHFQIANAYTFISDVCHPYVYRSRIRTSQKKLRHIRIRRGQTLLSSISAEVEI